MIWSCVGVCMNMCTCVLFYMWVNCNILLKNDFIKLVNENNEAFQWMFEIWDSWWQEHSSSPVNMWVLYCSDRIVIIQIYTDILFSTVIFGYCSVFSTCFATSGILLKGAGIEWESLHFRPLQRSELTWQVTSGLPWIRTSFIAHLRVLVGYWAQIYFENEILMRRFVELLEQSLMKHSLKAINPTFKKVMLTFCSYPHLSAIALPSHGAFSLERQCWTHFNSDSPRAERDWSSSVFPLGPYIHTSSEDWARPK